MKLEQLEERTVLAPSGPRVVAFQWGATEFSLTAFHATFDKPVDLSSIGATDVSLVGPNGPIPFPISPVYGATKKVVSFGVPTQLGPGLFTLTLGPGVLSKSGVPMNQDGDRVNGETPDDQFVASLTLGEPPVPPPPPPPPAGFQIDVSASGLDASQLSLLDQAIARWERVITGDLPDATYFGVAVNDLLIHVTLTPVDGPGGVLGSGGFDALRSDSLLPYHGSITIDSADAASLAPDDLMDVLTHEIGHVLGIGTLWQLKGLLLGPGTADPRFTGVNAAREYSALAGASFTSVPVENSGGPGTADSHWRESVFGNELMTGFLNTNRDNALSRVTVGSLEDLGYEVDYSGADAFALTGNPASKGGQW